MEEKSADGGDIFSVLHGWREGGGRQRETRREIVFFFRSVTGQVTAQRSRERSSRKWRAEANILLLVVPIGETNDGEGRAPVDIEKSHRIVLDARGHPSEVSTRNPAASETRLIIRVRSSRR